MKKLLLIIISIFLSNCAGLKAYHQSTMQDSFKMVEDFSTVNTGKSIYVVEGVRSGHVIVYETIEEFLESRKMLFDRGLINKWTYNSYLDYFKPYFLEETFVTSYHYID